MVNKGVVRSTRCREVSMQYITRSSFAWKMKGNVSVSPTFETNHFDRPLLEVET